MVVVVLVIVELLLLFRERRNAGAPTPELEAENEGVRAGGRSLLVRACCATAVGRVARRRRSPRACSRRER